MPESIAVLGSSVLIVNAIKAFVRTSYIEPLIAKPYIDQF